MVCGGGVGCMMWADGWYGVGVWMHVRGQLVRNRFSCHVGLKDQIQCLYSLSHLPTPVLCIFNK